MPGIWPQGEEAPPPLRWWQVVLGGLGFAAVAFALIWSFAILAFALGVTI